MDYKKAQLSLTNPCDAVEIWVMGHSRVGTVENHGKKWQKTRHFCENCKNHGKNTEKTRHQITGPKTIIQSIKFNIQHCRPSLHAVQGFYL